MAFHTHMRYEIPLHIKTDMKNACFTSDTDLHMRLTSPNSRLTPSRLHSGSMSGAKTKDYDGG